MTQNKASSYLIISILIALILSGAGGFILWTSAKEQKTALNDYKQANGLVQELKDRYLRTAQDEDAIREAINRYERLQNQGIVIQGTDANIIKLRLEWAEQIRKIGNNRRIPKLEFELLPQRTLKSLDAEKNFIVVASQMKIRAGLLHEGDLLRLLNDLQNMKDALVLLRSCELRRASNDNAGNDNVTLWADCVIDWVIVQYRETLPPPKPVSP